jgi:hypothetical protein
MADRWSKAIGEERKDIVPGKRSRWQEAIGEATEGPSLPDPTSPLVTGGFVQPRETTGVKLPPAAEAQENKNLTDLHGMNPIPTVTPGALGRLYEAALGGEADLEVYDNFASLLGIEDTVKFRRFLLKSIDLDYHRKVRSLGSYGAYADFEQKMASLIQQWHMGQVDKTTVPAGERVGSPEGTAMASALLHQMTTGKGPPGLLRSFILAPHAGTGHWSEAPGKVLTKGLEAYHEHVTRGAVTSIKYAGGLLGLNDYDSMRSAWASTEDMPFWQAMIGDPLMWTGGYALAKFGVRAAVRAPHVAFAMGARFPGTQATVGTIIKGSPELQKAIQGVADMMARMGGDVMAGGRLSFQQLGTAVQQVRHAITATEWKVLQKTNPAVLDAFARGAIPLRHLPPSLQRIVEKTVEVGGMNQKLAGFALRDLWAISSSSSRIPSSFERVAGIFSEAAGLRPRALPKPATKGFRLTKGDIKQGLKDVKRMAEELGMPKRGIPGGEGTQQVATVANVVAQAKIAARGGEKTWKEFWDWWGPYYTKYVKRGDIPGTVSPFRRLPAPKPGVAYQTARTGLRPGAPRGMAEIRDRMGDVLHPAQIIPHPDEVGKVKFFQWVRDELRQLIPPETGLARGVKSTAAKERAALFKDFQRMYGEGRLDDWLDWFIDFRRRWLGSAESTARMRRAKAMRIESIDKALSDRAKSVILPGEVTMFGHAPVLSDAHALAMLDKVSVASSGPMRRRALAVRSKALLAMGRGLSIPPNVRAAADDLLSEIYVQTLEKATGQKLPITGGLKVVAETPEGIITELAWGVSPSQAAEMVTTARETGSVLTSASEAGGTPGVVRGTLGKLEKMIYKLTDDTKVGVDTVTSTEFGEWLNPMSVSAEQLLGLSPPAKNMASHNIERVRSLFRRWFTRRFESSYSVDSGTAQMFVEANTGRTLGALAADDYFRTVTKGLTKEQKADLHKILRHDTAQGDLIAYEAALERQIIQKELDITDVSGMSPEEFSQAYAIHHTRDPKNFKPDPDGILEVTRAGQGRPHSGEPAVVVRRVNRQPLQGDGYRASVKGKDVEVVARDVDTVRAFEKGHKDVVQLNQRYARDIGGLPRMRDLGFTAESKARIQQFILPQDEVTRITQTPDLMTAMGRWIAGPQAEILRLRKAIMKSVGKEMPEKQTGNLASFISMVPEYRPRRIAKGVTATKQGTIFGRRRSYAGGPYVEDLQDSMRAMFAEAYTRVHRNALFDRLTTPVDKGGFAIVRKRNQPAPTHVRYLGKEYPAKAIPQSDLVRLVRQGEDLEDIHVVMRRGGEIYVPEAIADDFNKLMQGHGWDPESFHWLQKTAGIFVGLQLATPAEAAMHGHRIISLVAQTPSGRTGAKRFLLANPYFAQMGAMKDMMNATGVEADMMATMLAKVGAFPERVFSEGMWVEKGLDALVNALGWAGKKVGGEAGKKVGRGTGHVLTALLRGREVLFGRHGVDVRARIVMGKYFARHKGYKTVDSFRAALLDNPALRGEFQEFVNGLGMYDRAVQTWMVNTLRRTTIDPFAATQAGVIPREMAQLIGGPVPKGLSRTEALFYRMESMMNGMVGQMVVHTFMNKFFSNKWPWENPDGKVLELNMGEVGPQGRGKFLPAGFTSPSADRPARLSGVKNIVNVVAKGDPFWNAWAHQRRVYVNQVAAMVGPFWRRLFEAGTGKAPYVTAGGGLLPVSRQVEPDDIQWLEDVKTAALSATPLVHKGGELTGALKERDIPLEGWPRVAQVAGDVFGHRVKVGKTEGEVKGEDSRRRAAKIFSVVRDIVNEASRQGTKAKGRAFIREEIESRFDDAPVRERVNARRMAFDLFRGRAKSVRRHAARSGE